MAKQVNKSLFDTGEQKPKLSDKIELEKPIKKHVDISHEKIETSIPAKAVFADHSFRPLSEEQRKKLFPNKPLSLKELKASKGKK